MAILAAAILFWVNKEQSHSKRMLIVVLLVLALLNFNGVFFHAGLYLIYPWFHKIPIPFSLLVAPTAYLYVRSVLKGELKFKKYDWLLILPSILFAINLLPYYFLPNVEKKIYLLEYYKQSALRSSDGEGMLPAFVFPFLRVAWSLLFIVKIFKLINRFKEQANKKVLNDNAVLLKWLTLLNILLSGLVIAALFSAFIGPILKTTFNILNIALGISVFLICLALFFHPKILYGVFQPLITSPEEDIREIGKPIKVTQKIEEEDLSSELGISDSEGFRYKKAIEHYFKANQPFLQIDYTLEQLVLDVNIPRYILSAFINKEYGMGFREFLNRYRVQFMIENLDKPEWKSFTLDAIAAECGFKSRITFYKNFKQITGQTPSEFIKNRK
ncbi:MAG: hypothetical protein RLY89_1390 [Bacteroidota bacterium]|jgi:AraC-like DNA-binding protein